MGELDGVDDVLFGALLGAGLDHHDAVLGADDHDVEDGLGALGIGGVDDHLAVDEADADCADGAVEGDIGEGEGAGGAVDAEDVGIIFLVGGVDEGDDLGLVAEGLGEEGADGAVDLAGGEDLLFGGAAFALDEAAGDASAGVGELAVFDREGEEVDAFLGVGRGGGGGEDGVVAAGGEGGAGGLLGHASGLEFDVLAAGKLYCDVLLHGAPLLLCSVLCSWSTGKLVRRRGFSAQREDAALRRGLGGLAAGCVRMLWCGDTCCALRAAVVEAGMPQGGRP